MARKTLQGTIVSDKMQHTAVVAITHVRRDEKYLKEYIRTTKVKAHNEGNRFKTGELVIIEETRPMSKDKRWRIISKV